MKLWHVLLTGLLTWLAAVFIAANQGPAPSPAPAPAPAPATSSNAPRWGACNQILNRTWVEITYVRLNSTTALGGAVVEFFGRRRKSSSVLHVIYVGHGRGPVAVGTAAGRQVSVLLCHPAQ